MITGKILIHISFYFKKEKITYLKQVLSNFNSYSFSFIDIIIDTNSEETEKLLQEMFNSSAEITDLRLNFHCDNFKKGIGFNQKSYVFGKERIQFRVHKNLTHPFLLTWMHRENMKQNIDNYDFFMYTEDDILLPWEAILRWCRDTMIIYSYGYIRGFFVLERDLKGRLIVVNMSRKLELFYSKKTIEGDCYILLQEPYNPFWIYTKKQMLEFICHKAWVEGNYNEWGVRERAATGMVWDNLTGNYRVLIPIGNDNSVLQDTFAYHLDNKYVMIKDVRWGKIPVNKVILSNRIEFFLKRVFEYLHYKMTAPLKSLFKEGSLGLELLRRMYVKIILYTRW